MKKRRHEDVTVDDDEEYKPSGRTASNCKVVSRQQGKLSSSVFQEHFETLWKELSAEKRDGFTYLDSLWFSLYMKASHKEKVLSWIRGKQIFTKQYVFVPIVQWRHWFLLIFCNFGGSLESETMKPCILLLDSLQSAGPKRFEPAIRKFVLDIYEAEGRPENNNQIYRIPFMVPKVPQQKSGEECGNYVLYFTRLFMKSAPENFSIDEGYPYFMKEDWFGLEDYNGFCKELYSCK